MYSSFVMLKLSSYFNLVSMAVCIKNFMSNKFKQKRIQSSVFPATLSFRFQLIQVTTYIQHIYNKYTKAKTTTKLLSLE